MEDRLQDRPGAIRDISILPVERDAVSGAVPVPEAQRTCSRRDCELLVERAIPRGLDSREAAETIGCVACKSGEGSAVCLCIGYHWRRVIAVNYPRWEAAGLESLVLDYRGVTRRRSCGWSRCRRGCRRNRRAGCWCRSRRRVCQYRRLYYN